MVVVIVLVVAVVAAGDVVAVVVVVVVAAAAAVVVVVVVVWTCVFSKCRLRSIVTLLIETLTRGLCTPIHPPNTKNICVYIYMYTCTSIAYVSSYITLMMICKQHFRTGLPLDSTKESVNQIFSQYGAVKETTVLPVPLVNVGASFARRIQGSTYLIIGFPMSWY